MIDTDTRADVLNSSLDLKSFFNDVFDDKPVETLQDRLVDFRTFNESDHFLDKSELTPRQYFDCINILGACFTIEFDRASKKKEKKVLERVWSRDLLPTKGVLMAGNTAIHVPTNQEVLLLEMTNDPRMLFSPERPYTEATLLQGQGAGKDLVVSRMIPYMCYTLLEGYKDPSTTFFGKDGKSAGINLDIINVALKGQQGERVFFNYFSENVKESPYFKKYYRIMEQNRTVSKSEPSQDKGIIKIGGNSIIFPKRIRAFSETSESEAWTGYTPVAVILDELSGFTSKSKIANGHKMLNVAKTSVGSRKTTNFSGFVLIMSYPRQEEGDITYNEYQKSLMVDENGQRKFPHIYGSWGMSWDIKPKYLLGEGTFIFKHPRINTFLNKSENANIGIRVPLMYKELASEPESFMTQFMAIPKKTMGGWLEYTEKAYGAVNKSIRPLFDCRDYIKEIVEPDGTIKKYLAKRIHKCFETDINVRMQRHVMWLDAAEKFCDAVIGIGRISTIIREVDGKKVPVNIAQVVDIINWTPQPTLGLTVSLLNVRDFLVTEIKQWINVVEVYSDRWEGAALEEALKTSGVKAGRYNLNLPQYDLLKYALYNDLIEIFDEEEFVNRQEGELTSIEQIVNLEESPTGPKRKEGYKKDKADVVCGIANLLLGNLYTKKNRPNVQKGKLSPPLLGNYMQNISDFSSPNLMAGQKQKLQSSMITDVLTSVKEKASDKRTRYPSPLKG